MTVLGQTKFEGGLQGKQKVTSVVVLAQAMSSGVTSVVRINSNIYSC